MGPVLKGVPAKVDSDLGTCSSSTFTRHRYWLSEMVDRCRATVYWIESVKLNSDCALEFRRGQFNTTPNGLVPVYEEDARDVVGSDCHFQWMWRTDRSRIK